MTLNVSMCCYTTGTWDGSTGPSHTPAPSNAGSFGWSVVCKIKYDRVYVLNTGGARPEITFHAYFSVDNGCQIALPTPGNCALAGLRAHAHSYFVNGWAVAYFE